MQWELKFFIEGDEAHRGNVLARAYVKKLQKVLSFLGKCDKKFNSVRSVDYEIVELSKYNPTVTALRPVPKKRIESPHASTQWAVEQLLAIAKGQEPDERFDQSILSDLSELSSAPKSREYQRAWLTWGDLEVQLDDRFYSQVELHQSSSYTPAQETQWAEGVSVGSIVGALKFVDDKRGNRRFIILPAVGPKEVECTFPEDQRDMMNKLLFKTVRVSGELLYENDSPYPKHMKMQEIKEVAGVKEHLSDLRGLFHGVDKADDQGGLLID